jgi:hypothetical protein
LGSTGGFSATTLHTITHGPLRPLIALRATAVKFSMVETSTALLMPAPFAISTSFVLPAVAVGSPPVDA